MQEDQRSCATQPSGQCNQGRCKAAAAHYELETIAAAMAQDVGKATGHEAGEGGWRRKNGRVIWQVLLAASRADDGEVEVVPHAQGGIQDEPFHSADKRR
ncbi:hypothetical protein GCM10007052_31480 [Halioglobus japonicus]|nr:hypothetical protein GCM10007052_31480 [Halioglobus japonicus]